MISEIIAKELARERVSSQNMLEENINLKAKLRNADSEYIDIYNRLYAAAKDKSWNDIYDICNFMKARIME